MLSIFDNMARAGKINPPQYVANVFETLFPEAVNVEWYVNTQGFEAVFHHNQREMIAMLSANGELLETRHNLPAAEAPAVVKPALTPESELMNVIRVEKNAEVTFEIIYRNQKLDRFVMLIGEQGNILSDSAL
ncbi:MAG: hypothetical protein EOM83_10560 [Clostridia bacterium]|nr:hypothetical protein [Clostridia bacterium]